MPWNCHPKSEEQHGLYFQQDVPAYNDLRGALRAETMAFRKPVLLVHGDSGRFGIDKPMVAPNGTTVANFTRLQTFGPADAGWVRVGVDPAARDVFSFRAEIPPGAPAAPTAGAPCGTRSAPPDRWGHVIWIWMENKERDEVVGNPAAPYESALAEACGTARQYSSVASPSLPNYLAATAGRTFGVTDDAPPADHSFAADNLFRQVRALGRQARSYQEDMPGRCVLEPSGLYVVKHNPAPYYKGGDDRAACQRDNLPDHACVASAGWRGRAPTSSRPRSGRRCFSSTSRSTRSPTVPCATDSMRSPPRSPSRTARWRPSEGASRTSSGMGRTAPPATASSCSQR